MNTRSRSALLVAVLTLLVCGAASYMYLTRSVPVQIPVSTDKPFDPLNTTYSINDIPTVFVNGKAETMTTSTKITTMFFGQPVVGDLNGDGKNDAVVYITQDLGGSGTFFYVVAALNMPNSTVGTNAVLLGDRIAPQNIQIQNGTIIANYVDRKKGEPMTTQPSEGVSAYLIVHGTTLQRTPAPTQTISYLVSPEDSTKYCNGVDMNSAGYQKTITQEKTTSTSETNLTTLQTIKKTMSLATTGMCRTALDQLNVTESNGTVTIPPMEGWAGISIAMCSCKPQVEVNVLRIPGMTNVIWQ